MQTLLVLNIPPGLEEDLVDYLLSISELKGFTSYTVSGHGEHANLSLAEQVSGRRKRTQVEIILDEDSVQLVLSGLEESVGRDITWWQHRVLASGSFD